MILARPDVAPTVCSQRSMQIENSQFIDIYQVKSLKHQHLCGFINLLAFLKNSPALLAECMAIADQINQIIPSQNDSIVQIVCDGLYGSLINESDVDMVLQILERLIDLQIVNSENVRKILRPGSSTFARLYQRLHESIPTAKLFLVAALYEPVMAILIEDVKVDLREENDKQLQTQNIQKLFGWTHKFIKSLTDNWDLFPSILGQLVRKLYVRLQQNSMPDRMIHILITDLVFTNFICPAIVSPDLFGVSNVQIDSVARHNLIQIGQIIQKLAICNYEPVLDERFRRLYEKFESDVIQKLIVLLIGNGTESHLNFDGAQTATRVEIISIRREKLFISRTELNLLLDFLRTAIENDGLMLDTDNRKQLVGILDELPIRLDPIVLVEEHNHHDHDMKIQTNSSFAFNAKQKLTKAVSLQPNSSSSSNSNNAAANNVAANVELIQNPIETRASSFINGNIIRYGFSDEVLVFPMKYVNEQQLKLLSEDELEKEKNKSNNPNNEQNIEGMELCNEVKQIISVEENMRNDNLLVGNNEKER